MAVIIVDLGSDRVDEQRRSGNVERTIGRDGNFLAICELDRLAKVMARIKTGGERCRWSSRPWLSGRQVPARPESRILALTWHRCGSTLPIREVVAEILGISRSDVQVRRFRISNGAVCWN